MVERVSFWMNGWVNEMRGRFSNLVLAVLCVALTISSTAAGFSTHDTYFTRTFNATEAKSNTPIIVTVSFSSAEPYPIQGFYFTEHLPLGLQATPLGVKIDDNSIQDYDFDNRYSGEVYAGHVSYRWILEHPPGFETENSVPSGSNIQITYTLTSSDRGFYNLTESSWAGYFLEAPEEDKAAYGYTEAEHWQTLFFCFITALL